VFWQIGVGLVDPSENLTFSNSLGVSNLSINQATGAATFSSGVTASGYNFSGNSFGAKNSGLFFNGVGDYATGILSDVLGTTLNLQSGGGIALSLSPTKSATFSSSVTATGFFQSSDRRLKTILKRDGDMIYFKWKDGRDDKVHIGYIAQEVRKTNPDQVQKGENKMLSVNYVEILVEKIRMLEKRIEELEKK